MLFVVLLCFMLCVCRRKRGERDVLEAPGDVIVRKLTIERIEELKKTIQEQQQRYKSLAHIFCSASLDKQI